MSEHEPHDLLGRQSNKASKTMNEIQNPEEFEINLVGVRISYPHLFEHAVFKGKSTGKYSAKFLIDKETQGDLVKAIASKAKKLAAEAYAMNGNPGKLPPPNKLCIRDGDHGDKEEEEGHWIVSASESTPPIVVDRDRSPLAKEDDKIYAGCYVNAKIRLWAQDNEWGKRINANLLGVQFVKDGERLGKGIPRQSADEMFDTVEGFDDEDGAFDGGDESDPFA